jgi:hypothetical protein
MTAATKNAALSKVGTVEIVDAVYKLPLPPCSSSLITKHALFLLQNRSASHL